MQWVHEEGHCDADDAATGTGRRSGCGWRPPEEGAGRAGGRQGGDHRDDQPPHQGRAVRRGAAAAGPAGARSPPPPSWSPTSTCTPASYWTTVDGRTCPGPFVKASAWPLPGAAGTAGGRRATALAPRDGSRRSPRRPSASADGLPLDGLKVVDLTWVFAGPLATRVLADFGATVVKVEGPTPPRRVPRRRRRAARRPRRSRAASRSPTSTAASSASASTSTTRRPGATSCATSCAGPTCWSSRSRPA